MKIINLIDLLKILKYDWLKDEESLKEICYYTKTRVSSVSDFSLSWGMEQPSILKALADKFECSNMFEVGTGRGTACLMVSLCESIKEIKTIDILWKNQKRKTAIGHKERNVSNEEILDLTPIQTKHKIELLHRSELPKLTGESFDLFFIDGEHDKEDIIWEDYRVCKSLSNSKSIFVFDDYDPQRYSVKKVVDKIIETEHFYSYLIPFRGYLFPNKLPEKDSGLVVLSKEKIK